jgi:hypothetical protein
VIELERFRMGVDIAPETDYTIALHCFTDEIPTYSLEIENEDGSWVLFSEFPAEDLPAVVESMHYAFDYPVRLIENGYPVFTCWR